ncbi:MAG: RDD family protein [Candidatus Latescibacterota bacterium]
MAEEMDNTDTPESLVEHTATVPNDMEYEIPDAPPELIGFGKRLGAYLLDGIFTTIAAGVVGYALKDLFVGLVPIDPELLGEAGEWVAAISGAAGLCAVLYGLIEGFTGASPGKMILAIKIGNDNSTTAETSTLLKRYAIKTIASILALVGLILGVEFLNTIGNVLGIIVSIGCFFALGEAKQALHDKIVHTAVYPEETIP